MKDFDVAVIVPYYKSGRFAKQLAQTLSNQTYNYFQIFIIDDGKGEGWEEIFQEVKSNNLEEKVVWISTMGSTGPANARNIGIEFSRCRYVAFLDSDDTWNPSYLEQMINQIKTIKCYGLVSECTYSSKNKITRLKLPKFLNYNLLLQTNPIATPAVVLDRLLTGQVFFPNTGHEDYAMWLYLTKNFGPLLCVHHNLVSINRVSNSISSNKIRSSSWQWTILKAQSRKNLFSRSLLFLIYIINGIIKRSKSIYSPYYLPNFIIKLLP